MKHLQFVILPPTGAPSFSNWISMYFPNLLELSFRIVLAFPNAEKISGQKIWSLPSRMGFESMSWLFTRSTSLLLLETAAMYCIKILDASVFPAPDSPLHDQFKTLANNYLIITHWFSWCCNKFLYTSLLKAYTWGVTSYLDEKPLIGRKNQ